MQLIRGIRNLPQTTNACVATIGNFDGVHLGHQFILEQLKEQGERLGLPRILVTFEPYPREYFTPQSAPARLTRLREKVILLQAYGLEQLLILHFNQHLENLSPQDFIDTILVQGLKVQHLIVGDDFRFGHKRQGDVAMLIQQGQAKGFEVQQVHRVDAGVERISSSSVREALLQGDLQQAQHLLGRAYRMCGRVAHGEKRGRIIGFPTANIYLHRKASPILGVYAVRVYGIDEQPILGVANVGNRPTVDGTRSLLEVHLFDFNHSIYGQYLEVEFAHKLRDERRFDSFDLLKQQILKDAEDAKRYFENRA